MPRLGPAGMALAAMYALAIIGFPLVSTLPTLLGVDSQVATVPYRVLIALLSLVILYGWWVRGTAVLFNAAVLVTLTLWTLLVVRMVHDTLIDPLPGELYMPAGQLLLLSFGGCFLPALVALELPTGRALDRARRWIEVLGALAMLGILYVGLRGVLQGSVLYRLATPVLNPISVGHVGVSVMIVALCGYAGSGRVARLLRALLVVLSVGVVVASVSRGPIIAALLAVILLAVTAQRPGRPSLWRPVLLISLVAAGIYGIMEVINYLEDLGVIDVVSRLTDTLQDVASQERASMFLGAWQQFTEHPWFGDAFVERRFMENPHNIVLEAMMALGVVGLLLLTLSMGASLLASVRVLRASRRHAWVGLVYLQYVINGLLSGSLFVDGTFWFYALAVLALDQALRMQQVD
jgi:O-antigen ligase